MLKNKKAIYILIPLNIFIWGFFIYRFYTLYNEDNEVIISSNENLVKLDESKDSVTYKLALDYKDPFLKSNTRETNSNSKRNFDPQATNDIKPKVIKTPTVQPIAIPELKYLGLIKNSSSGNSTALVSLNGQTKLVKVNEVIEGYTIKSFDNSELVAFFGKEKHIIKK